MFRAAESHDKMMTKVIRVANDGAVWELPDKAT